MGSKMREQHSSPCRFAVKRTKKVFREDGGLSPAFCERLRHQIDIYHAVGHGLSIAHLYGAYEDAEYVYSVQELCTGAPSCRQPHCFT
jgi:serine/threonine protein kinase